MFLLVFSEVFRVLRDHLTQPSVRTVVMDFEKAVWRAIHDVFPGARSRGCAFHWGQAVDRQVSIAVEIP